MGTNQDVSPWSQILEDNWYNSPEDLADTSPEELSSLGLPLRFAKDLLKAAQSSSGRSESGGGKSRGKDWSRESVKESGKGKDKGKDKGKGKGKEKKRFEQVLELEPVDPGYNMISKLKGERGQNVHHIQDQTGAQIWIRADAGNSLRCEITGESRSAINKAWSLARELADVCYTEYRQWLEEQDGGVKVSPKGATKGKRSREGKKGKGKDGKGKDREMQYTQTIELDQYDAEFGFKGKLIGDRGRNVHHIQDQSDSKVWVQDEDPSSLRVEVSAETEANLELAVKLCTDLIGTLGQEYESWLESGKTTSSKKSRREQREDEDGEFSHVIEVQEGDAGFSFKSKIIGDKGRHVHHIQDESNAKVNVVHSQKGEPLLVKIRADTQEAVDTATILCQDLIETVQEEYQNWLDGDTRAPKGKGKGKKRKGKSWEDERPARRART